MDAIKQIIESISASSELGPFLVVSILVLAGFAGGWVAKLLKLPHVTGNIFGGIVVGPACLGLIGTHEQLHDLQPLSTFAMSLVAVSIGGHLSYRRIHNSLRRIIFTSLFDVGCSMTVVMIAARLFHMNWPMTFLLGADPLCLFLYTSRRFAPPRRHDGGRDAGRGLCYCPRAGQEHRCRAGWTDGALLTAYLAKHGVCALSAVRYCHWLDRSA